MSYSLRSLVFAVLVITTSGIMYGMENNNQVTKPDYKVLAQQLIDAGNDQQKYAEAEKALIEAARSANS